MKKGVLNRDLRKKDYPWLSNDLKKGKEVHEYSEYTYGCIGKDGIAVSDKPGQAPFYEVPSNSVTWN